MRPPALHIISLQEIGPSFMSDQKPKLVRSTPIKVLTLTGPLQFSTRSEGVAFYAVTRPMNYGHPNLVGREESTSKL